MNIIRVIECSFTWWWGFGNWVVLEFATAWPCLMGNFQVLVRMQSYNRTTPYGIIRYQGWAPAILTHLSLLNERFLLFQFFKNLKIFI